MLWRQRRFPGKQDNPGDQYRHLPGVGVGNTRKELSKETIGIPVIAIGVPTVVDAVTIAYDTIDLMLKYFNQK